MIDLRVYFDSFDCPSGCGVVAYGDIAVDGTDFAAGFDFGETIGPELAWGTTAVLASFDAGGCGAGVLCEPPQRFIGLRFTVDQRVHYAWLRAAGSDGSALYDFAFESQPDTPIAAGTGYPCTGDVDGNRQVDLADLTVVLNHFGAVGGAEFVDGDISGDGDIDLSDLGLLLATFGNHCDTCDWNDTVWIQRSPETSPPLSHYPGNPMAYDAAHGVTVLFSGNQTWAWDGTNWTRRFPSVSPPARAGHAMTYDSRRGVIVLFGGHGAGGYLGDTWEWDGEEWTERTGSSDPTARGSHGLAFDRDRDVTVLFGGTNDEFHIHDDTWEWDGTTWIERHPEVRPPARWVSGMVYDSNRGVTVLFGGGAGFATLADIWEWNGSVWSVNEQLMDACVLPSAAYDDGRQVSVLVSGSSFGHVYPGTFEWDGRIWSRNRAPDPPSPGGMAYDGGRQTTVLYVNGQTWELQPCSQ